MSALGWAMPDSNVAAFRSRESRELVAGLVVEGAVAAPVAAACAAMQVICLCHHEESCSRIEVPVVLPCHSLGVSEGNGLALGSGAHGESLACGISAVVGQ